MKVFISCSWRDKEVYYTLKDVLEKNKYEVLSFDNVAQYESNVMASIRTAILNTDIVIAVITENYLSSQWAQYELSFSVINNSNHKVLPIVVGEVLVPVFMKGFLQVRVKSLEEVPAAVLTSITQFIAGNSDLSSMSISALKEKEGLASRIAVLKEALNNNQLTLVCGAGISLDSSIPDWNTLLENIFNDIYLNKEDSKDSESGIQVNELLKLVPQSNLIIGKYIRLMLKEDFEKVVQKHLYYYYNQNRDFEPISQGSKPINYDLDTAMMRAIVALARPKRRGKRLESIITFNFDDIIENALSENQVDYCSIWKEGQIHGIDELPIYHVHGFLPNTRDLDEPNLVFAEEAYHSQFIDPYSWSNMLQLSTFSSNVCLFVGLSMSDPNLRRLLDISWRRNQRLKHFVILKKNSLNNKTGETAAILAEQDANSLGINVIWCSDYSEIPKILMEIAK